MIDITLIQIFVSCPSDVEQEKTIVKKVCERVNSTLIKSKCGIQFKVREWSEVWGQIGIHAQDSINSQISDYDIYLGILWMKFGTPTSNVNPETGQVFQSGTEEEFYSAYSRWERDNSVRINFFFKNNSELKNSESLEQYGKVVKFKEKLLPYGIVQSFDSHTTFEQNVADYLYEIGIKYCVDKKKEIKTESVYTKLNLTLDEQKESISSILTATISNFANIQHYIPRTLKPVIAQTSANVISFQTNHQETLVDLITKKDRIVLLGNAGSGKTTELQQLTKKFYEVEFPYIPIYKKFNTYIDQDIESFLPQSWREAASDVLLLIFDGLDEIQPQYFETAVRNINFFSENNPDLKIIVSCRTNFYDLPNDAFSGTLIGYECFYLNSLDSNEVIYYLNKYLQIDGESFIKEVYKNDYLDILNNPFFLNILIAYFKSFKKLSSIRTEIIDEFINSRILNDKIHFQSSIINVPPKTIIVTLLQRIAIVMELLGKNYLSSNDLSKILSEDDLITIKSFSAFNKDDTKDIWQFEHNNVQEFLAASVLEKLAIPDIKKLLTYRPNFDKIKPGWVNTLSFLISISPKSKSDELIKWLIAIDQEIPIKFEKEKVNADVRAQLFFQIFEYYKTRNIWLKSNKFSDYELAMFSESEDSLQYLLSQLSDNKNTNIVKTNALNILEHYALSSFNTINFENVKKELIKAVLVEDNDFPFIYSILTTMSELKMNDFDSLSIIVEKLKLNYNQYVRAGLYKVIGESNFVNEFADVFVDGMILPENIEISTSRESFTLGDEIWYLKKGLAKITSLDGLSKLFKYYEKPDGRKIFNFHDRGEIFDTLVKNSIKLYPTSPSIYNYLLDAYIQSASRFDYNETRVLSKFFEQTKLSINAFQAIASSPDISEHEREVLLALLVNKEVIDFIVEEYLKRNFTNENIIKLHRDLNWYSQRAIFLNKEMVKYLENKFREETELKLVIDSPINYEQIQIQKQQINFEILFSKDKLLALVNKFYQKIDFEKLTYESFWNLQRAEINSLESTYPAIVLQIISDFTRSYSEVAFEQIKKWIESSSNFEFYRIKEIHATIRNVKGISVNEEQKLFIINWVTNTVENLDWNSIVKISGHDPVSFSINPEIEILWFFITEFNIKLDENLLLNFTLYEEFGRSLNQQRYIILKELEKYVAVESIQNRVSNNVISGINISWIWKSNSLYALDNFIKDSYSKIESDLKDVSKNQYDRIIVLESYFDQTNNFNLLHEILENSPPENLQRKIIDILILHESQTDYLIRLLSQNLKNDLLPDYTKVQMASYLISLNQMEGLKFYEDYIVVKENKLFEFQQYAFFSKLKTLDAIPYLLRLLLWIKERKNDNADYNQLESGIISGIVSIGINSEENLSSVSNSLIMFIKQYSSALLSLNFLQYTIDKMEELFYQNKSNMVTIDDALNDITQIGIL